MNEEFLSFPYLVGMTFSSQNIDDIMEYRAGLGMGDSMITEPPAVEITEEHGKKQKLCTMPMAAHVDGSAPQAP